MDFKFALITKHRTPRRVIYLDDIFDFEKAIETLYWSQNGLKINGSRATREEFLNGFKTVKIYIEPIGG